MGVKKPTEEEYRDFFRKLDRKFFLPESLKGASRLDAPLIIGHGQTISQPTLVLEMTMLMDLYEGCKVLEIGTGSGYQTAFLAHFAGEVYTVEVYEDFSMKAETVLTEMGYNNVHYMVGNGSEGWPEHAPYDRIMVTAAAGKMPDKLIEQLAPLGRMVLPYGPPSVQELLVITKDEEGNVRQKVHELVRFVEFVGEYGWHEK
jgi:protein-L-isoaspartate(D-aspartate) O-methyltransferase